MKIGILGNTNNYPFTLAVLLRELGQEVVVVISEKGMLHRPESRYPGFKEGYPSWINDHSDLNESHFFALSPKIGSVLDSLSDCDAFILNSYWISCLPFLNAPGIALLTGSDLSHYANVESITTRTENLDVAYRNSPEGKSNLDDLRDFIERQRQGIRQAVAVRSLPRGLVSADDLLLDEIGVPDSKRVFLQASNLDRIDYVRPPSNERLRISCGTRITWKLPVEPGRSLLDYKGSDIMIRGLGQFYRETGIKLDIHLVRKGLHIADLQAIIDEEGISDQITWSDEMPLTQLWEEFAKSDIVFDQLADSAIGMAGLDAMATGRPVIGNAQREMFEDLFGEPSPVCQARTPEEVCEQLKKLVYAPVERERAGLAGRNYMEKYFNPKRSAEKIIEILHTALTTSKGQTSHRMAHSYYLQRLNTLQQELLSTQKELLGTQQELLLHIQQARNLAQTLELQNNQNNSVPAQVLGKWITDKNNNGKNRFERLKGPFQQQDGLCWIFQFPASQVEGDSPSFPGRSKLLLYEGDQLLGPAHAEHEDIRRKGGGKYSHWESNLYFSTSDGSDPNTNGRRYTVIWP